MNGYLEIQVWIVYISVWDEKPPPSIYKADLDCVHTRWKIIIQLKCLKIYLKASKHFSPSCSKLNFTILIFLIHIFYVTSSTKVLNEKFAFTTLHSSFWFVPRIKMEESSLGLNIIVKKFFFLIQNFNNQNLFPVSS